MSRGLQRLSTVSNCFPEECGILRMAKELRQREETAEELARRKDMAEENAGKVETVVEMRGSVDMEEMETMGDSTGKPDKCRSMADMSGIRKETREEMREKNLGKRAAARLARLTAAAAKVARLAVSLATANSATAGSWAAVV